MEQGFANRYWTSNDGLKLHFRDYPGGEGPDREGRPPVICLHGLTRNARDFAEVADRLAGKWRVIVPEMRGRGMSEYAADAATYNPLHYVQDLIALLEQEGIERFIAIGTSLGGLMTMLLAASDPDRIAAAVLNDIGPDVDGAGIERIREYVGQGRSYATWMHAARALQEVHGEAHPKFGIEQWLDMAKRSMVVQQNGRIGFDYDMKIAEPFAQDDGAAPPDLWPALQALDGRPVLFVRGERSDILTEATLEKMLARLPLASAVTIAGSGHAPLLTEPESVAAMDALFAKIT
uniref:alpha/beta fold hydrolase n=1 Tax=Parerythrobacter lutipelagi TaxID=1964208 RepID=UPI0010F7AD7F|nr:alpha/beta hydrolase [Parerythrobacter lutipelagi]